MNINFFRVVVFESFCIELEYDSNIPVFKDQAIQLLVKLPDSWKY